MNATFNRVTLYSYVVEHDAGVSPNPLGRICTLACCKFSRTGKRKNIVERARGGDWLIGLGGKNDERSSGHGTLVYAMRVTKTMTLEEYCKHWNYGKRKDAQPSPKQAWRRALISNDFYYFGRNAPRLPSGFFAKLKVQRSYKNHFPEKFISGFVTWLRKHKRGKNGEPCWQKDCQRCHIAKQKC